MKTCSKCKKEKDFSGFHLCKKTRDGYKFQCKECIKNYSDNRKKEKREYDKKYRIKNKAKLLKKRCLYIKKSKEQKREYDKKYRAKNRERLRKQKHDFYEANKVIILKKERAYKNANRDKINKRKRELARFKRANDPRYRLNRSISNGINKSINRNKKGYRWESLVGYTIDDLTIHLEKQFSDGMTWDNYGKKGWHIDHKIPISWWEIESIKDPAFEQCWALSNLQPLWENENCSKRDRYMQR